MADAQLRACMVHVVKVARMLSRTKGAETFAAPVSVKAYLENSVEEKHIKNGRARNSDHTLITEDEIKRNDRVWLPGLDSTKADESRRPEIVETHYDVNGDVDHYEVIL